MLRRIRVCLLFSRIILTDCREGAEVEAEVPFGGIAVGQVRDDNGLDQIGAKALERSGWRMDRFEVRRPFVS